MAAVTMLPPPEALPQVLPTERLNERGMPLPPIRNELRRIANVRNIGSVVLAVGQPIATITAAAWVAHPIGYLMAFLAMGPAFARLAILGHEAAHRLLFSHRSANDLVGRWLLSYPGFTAFEAYRRVHFAHHREEFGPNEPDRNLYDGYPITKASFQRKMRRDATGISGWKNLRPLLLAVRSPTARPVALRIIGAQVFVAAVMTGFGRPELYPLLWLGPWMTTWRVINRVRSIAEHGGMTASSDRRLTTHHVEQNLLARMTIVPFNTGWHLAHHVDMGVPWRNLPALHDELVRAGWVTPAITYPTYRALLSKLAGREDS